MNSKHVSLTLHGISRSQWDLTVWIRPELKDVICCTTYYPVVTTWGPRSRPPLFPSLQLDGYDHRCCHLRWERHRHPFCYISGFTFVFHRYEIYVNLLPTWGDGHVLPNCEPQDVEHEAVTLIRCKRIFHVYWRSLCRSLTLVEEATTPLVQSMLWREKPRVVHLHNCTVVYGTVEVTWTNLAGGGAESSDFCSCCTVLFSPRTERCGFPSSFLDLVPCYEKEAQLR